MKSLKNLALLKYRHKAEEAAAALPALIAAAEKAAVSVLAGDHALRRPGTGEKFWQFRDYDRQSDRPQDIDWRQSAKGDRLFVRQKEKQTSQTVLMWCQNDAGMAYRSRDDLPTKRDAAMILSLGLAIMLARAGEQFAALAVSGNPGRTEAGIVKTGQELIGTATGGLPVTAGGRTIPKNSSLFLAGDFLEPPEKIAAAIDDAAGRASGGLLVQVLDPAEMTLPFAGRAIFARPDGAERYPVDNVETIRAAYRLRLEGHIAAIRSSCRKNGWQWILHRTDGDIRQTLFDIWAMLSPAGYGVGGGT